MKITDTQKKTSTILTRTKISLLAKSKCLNQFSKTYKYIYTNLFKKYYQNKDI